MSIPLADQIKFIRKASNEASKQAAARRQAETCWADMTDDMERKARQLTGTKLPRRGKAERLQIAESNCRIAIKHDAEVSMYEAILATLEER